MMVMVISSFDILFLGSSFSAFLTFYDVVENFVLLIFWTLTTSFGFWPVWIFRPSPLMVDSILTKVWF